MSIIYISAFFGAKLTVNVGMYEGIIAIFSGKYGLKMKCFFSNLSIFSSSSCRLLWNFALTVSA